MAATVALQLQLQQKQRHLPPWAGLEVVKPGEFLSMTYSTIGTRGVVDMCVWSIGFGVDELIQMRSELMRSPLGGYLNSPHNFLAMTKRSQYQIDRSTSLFIRSGRLGPGICCQRRNGSG